MSDFWPNGLDLSDTQSPMEILRVAQKDWHQKSEGIMELVFQDATTTSGNTMIIVHAKHVASNRTSTLFSIVHRPNNPYPVRIQLEANNNLPDVLKKTYPKSTITSAIELIGNARQTISNPWVSDTPPEFREKLSEAFNDGSIKSIILNLALDTPDDTNGDNQEYPKEN